MSLIALPSSFRPTNCSLRPFVNQRVGASPFGGSEQVVDLLNDRWAMTCQMPPLLQRDAGWLEAFIGSMRGQVNWASLWHFARPMPLGTARGTQVLASTAAQHAASLSISGVSPSNGNYQPGDMLGVGGLLLMVAETCTAVGGSITVPLVNRLRFAVSSGSAVTWYRPTANFRLVTSPGLNYGGGVAAPSTLEFVERVYTP